MRKTIVILICLLLIASGVPLFAHGHRGHHGHHHGWARSNNWHGSGSHPSWHGRHGWGPHGPGYNPDDPSNPPGDPQEDPGDKPGQDPGDDPGDGPVEDPGDKGATSLEKRLPLNPVTGSFPG